jgi:hypothetical protein
MVRVKHMKCLVLLPIMISMFLQTMSTAQPVSRQRIHEQLLAATIHQESNSVNPTAGVPEIAGNQKKSVFLAALFSLILPGAGEYYAEGYSRGKYFTIAETGLWMTYAGFQIYGNHERNDAREYAAQKAGFVGSGKDDDYFVNIGNFDNIYQYNEKKLQDRTIDLLYDPSGGDFWQWSSTADRLRYRGLRISSDNTIYNSRFIIAVVIVNHIASAISAGKAAADYNKALRSTTGSIQWRFYPQLVSTSGVPDGIALGIETRF